MHVRRTRRHLALCAAATMLCATAHAACEIESGPATAALVELYTSEGCSSCPPADRQLSALSRSHSAEGRVVPLSLHVGYWDYIGWRDPYAQPVFAQRHRWLTRINRSAAVYTPHFFVAGKELGWRREGLAQRVRRVNATPAAATIRIAAQPSAADRLDVDVDARASAVQGSKSLYVAVTESGLVFHVDAGENRGVTLVHDHVARVWIGPLRLQNGHARMRRAIKLQQTWRRGNLAVVAFVQDDAVGTVLQALAARECLAQ